MLHQLRQRFQEESDREKLDRRNRLRCEAFRQRAIAEQQIIDQGGPAAAALIAARAAKRQRLADAARARRQGAPVGGEASGAAVIQAVIEEVD